MPVMEREAGAIAGPMFSRDSAGNELFTHTIDGANRVGPRPATDEDRKAHPAAYESFKAGPADDQSTTLSLDAYAAESATLRADLDKARSDLVDMTKQVDQLTASNDDLTKQRDEMLVRASMQASGGSASADDGQAAKGKSQQKSAS